MTFDLDGQKPPYRERLFEILRENLVKERPQFANHDVILCPLCLRQIERKDLVSVEHILPKNILRQDPAYIRKFDLARRSGLTVLCREARTTRGGARSGQGCNGWKGQKYDRLFKGMVGGQKIDEDKIEIKHLVAILTMAYLGTFQRFGYGCILETEFHSVREQFDFPEELKTKWLPFARMRLEAHDPNSGIWATSSGLPFVFGWTGVMGAALEVYFRRFQAVLPGGHWRTKFDPALLLPAVIQPPPAIED